MSPWFSFLILCLISLATCDSPHDQLFITGTPIPNSPCLTTSRYYKLEDDNVTSYTPPMRINYSSTYYPVYHGKLPPYVNEYRTSGSRFADLLTGLALYNLGIMSSSPDNFYDPRREYNGCIGEECKLRVNITKSEFEEARFECKLMAGFVYNAQGERLQFPTTTPAVTVTTGNVNTTDALHDKGPSLSVTPETICDIIWISRGKYVSHKNVSCGLLQAYTQNSFRNNGWRNTPLVVFSVIFSLIILLVIERK